MIYNFDTEKNEDAIAALVVCAIYRSRDKKMFKVSPEMWGQIERFCKASAKRALNTQQFIESFKKKMCCHSISPKWTEVGVKGRLVKYGSDYIELEQDEKREFLTSILKDVNHKAILDILLKETSWVIALVRDRIEQEKSLEKLFEEDEDAQL